MNNFERIKQMSVDEMAEFFSKISSPCVVCSIKTLCEFSTKGSCENAHKQWLLRECE